MLRPHRQRGFTFVELAVVLGIVALLAALAAPGFRGLIGNSQVRALADSLQNGLRLAQTEAVRRYRTVIVFRSNAPGCDLTASAASSGGFWKVRTVPLDGETAEMVQCGTLGELGAGGAAPNVWMSGETAVCFNADGRLVTLPSGVGGTGIGTACTVRADGSARYVVEGAASNRKLQVRVTPAGSVRLCDPSKTYSSTAPDGCPP